MTDPTPEQIEAEARERFPELDSKYASLTYPAEAMRAHNRSAFESGARWAALTAAAGVTPQEPSLSDAADALRENAREIEDAQLAAHGMIDPITSAVIAGIKQSAAMVCELAVSQVSTVAPVQVDEAKLAEVISDSTHFSDYADSQKGISGRIARSVAEWLRGGGQ